MGIGNSTSGAAIASALTKRSTYEVTGHGTGAGLSGWRHKCQVIEDTLDRHKPDPEAPIDLLSAVGGFEIGAITGILLAAAAARVPILIDGLVSSAGAAIAAVFTPQVKQFMVASARRLIPDTRPYSNTSDWNQFSIWICDWEKEREPQWLYRF